MSLSENLRIAVRTLQASALRSALAMLGIVIGVAAVIAMAAVGYGAQKQVSDRIRSLGTNVALVSPGSTKTEGVRSGAGSRLSLSEDDARAIAAQLPHVIVAAPALVGSGHLVRGNQNWATLTTGITPDYLIARDWLVAKGRGFSPEEIGNASKVVLLGGTTAKRLFNEEDPIGSTIRIGAVPFLVVGVLAEKGQTAAAGRDQDDVAFIPISTAKLRVLGGRGPASRQTVDLVLVKATSEDALPSVMEDIRSLLRQLHRISPHAEDDFQVREPSAAMEAQAAATRTLTFLLGAIASVSLIVGGIGIMNIMLVSVTERTREIGLRQALGARRSDIRNQFLAEVGLLCLLGGVIGVLLGMGSAHFIAEVAGWPIFLSWSAILIGLFFAGVVGVFFGLYPAQKAARLNIVDALRYE
jgi:putative ABC transport system permease protein